MKIFDMHIHASNTIPAPKDILLKMEKAGICGGCIFSNKPYINKPGTIFEDGTSFDERLNEVLEWTKGYEDRLFPVIWIHPEEENIIANIHKAAQAGICGFKIICNDFYVYEENCMKVLREIASLNKPVFFHSGILWDKGVSSKYNRPLNWEALLEIEGLKFSMGHCSWPWIDECIALYGKFLNSLTHRNTAEMFFDITPGTPKIYREELLTKLYTVGYDVGKNVMFGTDASAENYNSAWAKDWIKTDGEIMQKLGVSRKNLESLYHDNLMRFLGKNTEKINHVSPVSDNAHAWSAENGEVKEIIKHWYLKLGFSKKYDDEFFSTLENIKISDSVTAEGYDENEQDGKRNLLSFLFMCDEVSRQYKGKGIGEDILLDTLADLPRWTDIWSNLKNELYFGELSWLKRHMSLKLFKLGRLQFCMAKSEHDFCKKGISKGDNVIEIHIPQDGVLDIDECVRSIEMAKEFFAKYFAEFKYEYFTCHSWLLDRSLEEILSESSNILKFQKLFEIISDDKSDSILGYIFRWKADRNDIKNMVCSSSLAENVKKRILAGGDFYESLGIIKK